MTLARKRVAIYARYSTDQQSEASIVDQVHRCRRYVEDRGGAVQDEDVFTDAAMSGTSMLRPAFEKMMAAARRRTIDVIVTEDTSRLSRDLADSAAMFKELAYLCVPVIAVADGIDTSTRGAKMQVTLKSLMSDMFIEDLRDKTRRGLEGRARAGLSTGGLPIGYRSEPMMAANGREAGNRIMVDEVRADIVRRIFATYVDGESFERIAHRLNAEGVEPARRGRYRNKGWTAETVRAILKNKAYTGEWTYGRRTWVKVPGTNKRRPRTTPASNWIVASRPDLRIIDMKTWADAQVRMARVSAHYAPKAAGGMKTSTNGRRTSYALSGLLRCGVCGGVMIIAGGSSAQYYRCGQNKKRGTCPNRVTVREDLVRSRVIGAVKARFSTPSAVSYLRKRISERLGEMGRELSAEVAERRARLERTMGRLANMAAAVGAGEGGRTLFDAMRDLEVQRAVEESAIRAAEERARVPIALPSPDDLIRRAGELEVLIMRDPSRGRDALARLFAPEGIAMTPDEERVYTARSTFFPLGLLALGELTSAPQNMKTRHPIGAPGSPPDSVISTWSSAGCAGRI